MITSLFEHFRYLLCFKHDGSGLPKTPSAMAFIVGLAILCSATAHIASIEQISPGHSVESVIAFSSFLLIIVTLISPAIGVAIAIVEIGVAPIVIFFSLLNLIASIQPLLDIIQLAVVVYFAVARQEKA